MEPQDVAVSKKTDGQDGPRRNSKRDLLKRLSKPIRSERKMLEFAYSFAGPASQRRDSMVGGVLGTH